MLLSKTTATGHNGRLSDRSFRVLFESALDAILIADDKGRYVDANPMACEIFGVPRDKLIGKCVTDFVDPTRITGVTETWDDFRRKQVQKGEFTLLRPDGEVRILEYSAVADFQPGLHLSILRDITDRKRTEQELVAAVRARDEFLSIASHELRTPLTAMKLEAQLIQRRASTDAQVGVSFPSGIRRFSEQVNHQVERLSRLVDDMLDVSRIESGKLKMRFERLDLRDIVREVTTRLSSVLLQSKSTLAVDLPPTPIWGDYDRQRLEQVVTNLLTNAARYGAGKPIEVALTATKNNVELTVKDQGRGIAPEDQQRIFQRFERANHHADGKGLGLGLYIVKQIVSRHQGDIRVESELGKGATFIVTLPVARSEL